MLLKFSMLDLMQLYDETERFIDQIGEDEAGKGKLRGYSKIAACYLKSLLHAGIKQRVCPGGSS